MQSVFRLETNATLLTVAVSLWFLVRLWRESELYGKQQVVFGLWFIVALGTQLFARGMLVWGAGPIGPASYRRGPGA